MPLRRVLLFLVLIGLLTPALISGFVEYIQLQKQALQGFSDDRNRLEAILVYGVQELLWNFDKDSANNLIKSALSDPRVNEIVIYETGGTLFLEAHGKTKPTDLAQTDRKSIVHGGDVIGQFVLVMDPSLDLNAISRSMVLFVTALFLQLVFSLFLIVVFLNRRFVVPVRRLEEQSSRLASQKLSEPFVWVRRDELGQLGRSLEVTRQSLVTYKENLKELVEERTRELQIANRELEAFSYSVSHDLRAPLRGIEGYGAALVEDFGSDLDPKAAEYVQRMRRAVARMSGLIDDLLNLSRVTRSQMKRSQTNLTELALGIFQELCETEPDRRVDFFCQSALTVYADPGLMKIALQNLLGNAWKYTSKVQKPWVRFLAFETQEGKVYTIEDNGVGFPTQDTAKLFHAFHRLHDSVEFPGNGIGLAVVQRIVSRHGGRVWAEGEPEKGAKFHFTLGPFGAAREGNEVS